MAKKKEVTLGSIGLMILKELLRPGPKRKSSKGKGSTIDQNASYRRRRR